MITITTDNSTSVKPLRFLPAEKGRHIDLSYPFKSLPQRGTSWNHPHDEGTTTTELESFLLRPERLRRTTDL